jgi:flagellar FliL protein
VSGDDQSKLKMFMTRFTETLRSVFQTKKKIVVISGAAVAGVLVTLLCIWLVLPIFSEEPGRKTAVNQSARQNQTGAEGSASAGQKAPSNILVLDPFEKIPLKNSKTMGYLNVDIAVELSDPGFSDLVNQDIYKVRQTIEQTAGEMTWFELRSPEGKIHLKYNLIRKINSLYTGAVVRNLYFTSFLMQ